jgi:fatty acid-binding protein DegV
MLKGRRKLVVAGCAPNMQKKMFRDAFAEAGMDISRDLIPLDIREMTTQDAVAKVQKALEALVKTYQDLVLDKDAPLGVVHGDCAEDAEHLAGRLRESGCRGEILVSCFEPVTGSHVGPGAVALFFYGIHR